jgi:anaerobic selenocysteine-containing dehydrogenase
MTTPAPAETASDTQTHYRICPLCEACCGLEVKTQGNRVIGIRGAAHDVFSRGYLCPKGYALKDLHEDPDRLRQPLIRRNGRHEPATWDEAFALIEQRLTPLLATHGKDALALSVGNPTAHRMGLLLYFARLARATGSRNIFSASTLDQMPKQLSSGWMFGHWLSVAVPDIERCQHLVILGANPAVSNGSMWTVPDFRGKAKALRARGGRLVTIDPRRTETAQLADEHHFIRPGGDVFLLAAMARTLLDDGLPARFERLRPMIRGLDALPAALADFTPERCAPLCGLSPEAIRQLARGLAAADAGCLYARIGTCTQAYGTLASWLVDVINTLCGHLDAPGGAMFARAAAFAQNTQGRPGLGRGISTGRHRSRVSGAPEVYGELPITCLAEEIETPGQGQVRALITCATNPVLSSPGGPRLAQALSTLDFMVSVDIYLNETTRHADVILPGLSALEEAHYDVAFPQLSHRNHARYSLPVFDAPAGHPPEWQTLLRLTAIVTGRGADADVLALDDELLDSELRRLAGDDAQALRAALGPSQGPQRLLDIALRSGPYGDQFGRQPGGLNLATLAQTPGGIDLGPLQPRLPELLRTPSGAVELAPPELLADMARARAALEPAPGHAAPAEATPTGPAAPLMIIGRREVRSNNSWMHNLPTLSKGAERCTLLMHPDDAALRGLAAGSLVRVHNGHGSVQAPLVCTDELMPGVVSLPHGWGHDLSGAQLRVAARRPGANLNALLDDAARDPLSGNAVLSGEAVWVEPAAASASMAAVS